MLKIFNELVKNYTDLEDPVKGLKELKQKNGYMYKLSQDFLLSSSTMEKEEKLEKIVRHLEKKY